MSAEEEIVETVKEAKSPGRFKIVDVLRDKSFPTDEVEIFIEEGTAFEASQLDEDMKDLAKQLDKSPEDKELLRKYEEFTERKDKIIEEMGGTRYVFHLTGISEGRREDLYEKAVEKYPIEYEVDRNPFTGDGEKKEKSNTQRDRYFTNLLWEAHITKIVAPDGAIQESINFDEAVELRRTLPLASIGRITEAIEKMRTATAVFMMTTDEDFLAKS